MTKKIKQPFEIHLKTPDGDHRTVELGNIDLVAILAKNVNLGFFMAWGNLSARVHLNAIDLEKLDFHFHFGGCNSLLITDAEAVSE